VTAGRLVVPPDGCPEAGCGESGVRGLGEGRDHQAVEQPLGLYSPHGEEAGWVVAVLRRLSLTQQCHRS
jgi:hypothetical protein